MPEFELNLIHEQVAPLKKRKLIFSAMVAYLALCGLVLVLVFGSATKKYLSSDMHRSDITRLEKDFKKFHPDQEEIKEYASLLQFNIKTLSHSLSAFEKNVTTRSDIARIIMAIAISLPDNTYLVDFRFEQDKQLVSFEIAAPIAAFPDAPPDAASLVTIWSHHQDLKKEVTQLRAVASKRKIFSGKPVFVLKFSGSLTPKGAA